MKYVHAVAPAAVAVKRKAGLVKLEPPPNTIRHWISQVATVYMK